MFVLDKLDRIGPELVECCEVRQEARRRGNVSHGGPVLVPITEKNPEGRKMRKGDFDSSRPAAPCEYQAHVRAILPVADVVDVKYVEAKAQQGFEKKLNMLLGAVEPWQEHVRIVGEPSPPTDRRLVDCSEDGRNNGDLI